MGDFKRHQVRAIMVIEKDEEILLDYMNTFEFVYSSRKFRRQKLLESFGFLCECSECSLEGEDLEDNEMMRAEILEKQAKIDQLLGSVRSQTDKLLIKKSVKKSMKLCNQKVKLIEKLNIRVRYLPAMLDFWKF